MAMVQRRSITGKQKAAILLVSLEPDAAAQLLKRLTDEEIEDITLEIATLEKVPPDLRGEVVGEFYNLALAQQYISKGGVDYARQLLEKAVGPHRAQEIITDFLHLRLLPLNPYGELTRCSW
jgi:flagellar motor switch protein FliG